MMDEDGLERGIRSLDAGTAFVDRSGAYVVVATGADAVKWLNDLLTADVADVGAGASRRSLLLSATGRIQADVAVVGVEGGLALVQLASQDNPIDRLLAPYVLSSDVRLDRVQRGVLCAPGTGSRPPSVGGGLDVVRPSMLGDGFDLLAASGTAERRARETLRAERTEVTEAVVRAWEIRRGVPRFPDDFGADALPAEAGLGEPIVAEAKGCFLGQESVAKIRNLGHPPHAIVAVHAQDDVVAGEPVLVGDAEVGVVTGASRRRAGGVAALIRVRWSARGGPLATRAGVPLVSSFDGRSQPS
jgi:tRNA-modifying protein YgfZ